LAIREHLGRQEGVADVKLSWNGSEDGNQDDGKAHTLIGRGRSGLHDLGADEPLHVRSFHGARIREITPPRFDSSEEHGTLPSLNLGALPNRKTM
jgi:hypothetical protein